jgi:hypothetical protein
MDIPINATVQCNDGLGGRSTHIVVNPITEEVTHIVVKAKGPPQVERLVPIMFVKATTLEQIQLSCSRTQLGRLRPFIETEFIQVPAELLDLASCSYDEDEDLLSLPFASLELPHGHTIHEDGQELLLQQYEVVPPGETAIRRGTRVQATDGRVGWVDEFVIDPESKYITHLTMRRGHLWGEQEISIPVSEIARIAEDVVYLELDKRQIKALPVVKVRRRWQ